MSKRVTPLTPADLPDLPSCAGAHPDFAADDVVWPRLAMDHLGLCGVSAHQNDDVVAFALVVPGFAVPDGHRLAHPPRTPDAVALLSLWVDESYARLGWGRQLVQSLSARLVGRARCIEAAASEPGTCCEPSAELLTAVGFVAADVPPRYRLDLDLTVATEPQWSPAQWRRAVTRVAEWVQQPRPEPTGLEPARRGAAITRG